MLRTQSVTYPPHTRLLRGCVPNVHVGVACKGIPSALNTRTSHVHNRLYARRHGCVPNKGQCSCRTSMQG